MKLATLTLAGLLTLAVAAAAQASITLQVTNHGLVSSSSVTISHDNHSSNTHMGNFHLSISGYPGDFYAYCIDLDQTLGTGTSTWNVTTDLSQLDAGMSGCQLNALYGLFELLDDSWTLYGLQHNSKQDLLMPVSMTQQTVTEAAAVQLMVWEIAYDFNGHDASTIDLNSGAYAFSGSGVNSNVVNRFNTLKTDLFNSGHVCPPTPTAVPSPAAVFAGFGLIGGALLRRTRKPRA